MNGVSGLPFLLKELFTSLKEDPLWLISGVSPAVTGIPAVSDMIGRLIQDPRFSFDPRFPIYLLAGFAAFAVSLYRFLFFKGKHDFKGGVHHTLGMSFAGFVLVSWSKYQSATLSIVMLLLILIALCFAYLREKATLETKYGKDACTIPVALFVSAVFSLIPIMPSLLPILLSGWAPSVHVSPSSTFINMPSAGMSNVTNVGIKSVNGDAWNIRLTAKSPNRQIAVYLDDIKNGPVEIPFLRRGDNLSSVLKIETSPLIPSGSYIVILNYMYTDISRNYTGSENVEVFVGELPISYAQAPIPPTVLIIAGIILVVVVYISRSMRRAQK